jgi:hypothetical protein
MHTAGYVGEKGIGFKSVFKVAEVVWVASGHYTFKFDKNQQLGMIAPIWVPPQNFPGGALQGITSFFLQLAPESDREKLVKELRSLHATLLIFLRRLRRVDIRISDPSQQLFETTLSRKDAAGDDTNVTTLVEGTNTLRYIVVKKIVDCLPPEVTRPGISKTEIILAYPFNGGEPWVVQQQVYAFLPIRHYGFNVSLLTYAL